MDNKSRARELVRVVVILLSQPKPDAKTALHLLKEVESCIQPIKRPRRVGRKTKAKQ